MPLGRMRSQLKKLLQIAENRSPKISNFNHRIEFFKTLQIN